MRFFLYILQSAFVSHIIQLKFQRRRKRRVNLIINNNLFGSVGFFSRLSLLYIFRLNYMRIHIQDKKKKSPFIYIE